MFLLAVTAQGELVARDTYPWSTFAKRRGEMIERSGIRLYLLLEQAVEKGSPNEVTVVEAHRQGLAALTGHQSG